jgi:hypothetical protein
MTAPFLSVVTRTQGRRPGPLAEALASLAAQTDPDLELLLIAHRVGAAARASLRALLDTLPEPSRARARLIDLDHGNRTTPLNVGFGLATGEYVAILDDDDLALPGWVATFRRLAAAAPGRVLRAATRQQAVAAEWVGGELTARPLGPLTAPFPDAFDMFEHLSANRTPPVSLAFPRARLLDLGLRFDEDLTTAEDWDFLMRCVGPLGIAGSAEVTAIYRWWERGECSRTEHSDAEFAANYHRICAKWDAAPFVLPPGGFLPLRDMRAHQEALRAGLDEARAGLDEARASLDALRADVAELRAERDAARAAAEARDAELARRDQAAAAARDLAATLRQEVEAIRASRCWRLTAPLRALRRA